MRRLAWPAPSMMMRRQTAAARLEAGGSATGRLSEPAGVRVCYQRRCGSSAQAGWDGRLGCCGRRARVQGREAVQRLQGGTNEAPPPLC